MKKLLLVVVALMLVFSMAACGGTAQPTTTAPATTGAAPDASSAAPVESTPASAPASQEASAPADGATGTLTVAALESAYGADVWKTVTDAFMAKHPGIKVELVIDKNLEDVIGPQMKAGNSPDVIHLGVGRPAALTETMIKENAMEDISGVLDMKVDGEETTVKEKILPGFLDSTITAPYNDGKTYMAPMFYSPCGLFYNAALLEEKGWEVPKTFDEMWALGDKAAKEGIALFAYPTTGYFDAFSYSLMLEAGGPEFFTNATRYGEGVWDSAEAKTVFDTVNTLATKYTEKTVPANANNDNYLKNQQLILDNKAIFMPNGTWVVGEMAEAPRADGFKWGMTALPALKDGGDQYSYTFFEQAWVPAAAKNKDNAKLFLSYLYSDEAAELFAKGGAVQPIAGMSDRLEGDNKMFYSIYDNGAKAAVGAFAATNPVEGVSMADAFFGTVNSLVSGDKTQEQWVAAVKEASDALRPELIG